MPAMRKQHAWLRAAVPAALAVAWEVAAHLAPRTPLAQTPLVPSWEFIFGPSLLGMADYWQFHFWAPNPVVGGAQTYLGAFLALAYHSGLTWMRLLAGLALGTVLGVALGLGLSLSRRFRRIAYLPVNFLRMVPLLALIPLFQFWVGTNTAGVIVFAAFGTGVVYLVGTINAVSNVPDRYVEYARTLGARGARLYLRVILPAVLPELFSSFLLVLGLAWSATIAGEYVGIDTGLGRILVMAQFMSQTGRMALVTLLLLLYAGASYWLAERLAARLLRWMPEGGPQ